MTLKTVSTQGTHGRSVVEKGVEIAAAMDDAKDQYVQVFNSVDDNVLAHRIATAAGAEIALAGTPRIREAREHEKAVGEVIDEAVGNLDAAAFHRGITPNLVKIGFGAG